MLEKKIINDTKIKLIAVFFLAVITSCITIRALTGQFIFDGRTLIRCEIISIVYFYILCHFIIKIDKLYDFIFKYRWIIGLGIIIFLAANKLHGSSIGMFDSYIQPGYGSEYINPILGENRPIRSDEWLVSTPGRLSTFLSENPFSKYNNLLRGTNTLNELSMSFEMIGYKVFKYFFLFFGMEYGFSLFWFAPIVLAFLVNFELYYILTKKDRLVSVSGAALTVLSSYYMWWSGVDTLIYVPATLVCFYYFIIAKSTLKKILFGIGILFSFVGYIFIMYPAWIVPMGYIALAIAVSFIIEEWDRIKKFDKWTWIIFGGVVIVGLLMILGYFRGYFLEYSEQISSTVYPGQRREYGGSTADFRHIDKLFYYFQQVLYPFKDTGNNSEASTLISFFPIPLLLLAYQWLVSKKKDILPVLLLIIGGFYSIYVVYGIPEWIGNVTLLSYCTSARMTDVVGYICVVSFVIVIARKDYIKQFPWYLGMLIGIAYAYISYIICKSHYPEYMSSKYVILMSFFVIFIVLYMCSNTNRIVKKIACILIIGISVVSSAFVHPLNRGLDVIYSKPLAQEIMNITKEDNGKWITCGSIVESSYAVMCGAPTVNYVNTYPNLELWQKLDPTGTYNDVYNRYAHVSIDLTYSSTSFELVGPDNMTLHLSYEDIPKLDVKYVLSRVELQSNEYVSFNMLYNEGGCIVYEMIY